MTVGAFFIGGRNVKPAGRRSQPVLSPATGAVIGEVALAEADEIDAAVAAAKAAQPGWAGLAACDRGAALRRLAAEIEARAETIGAVLAAETGKSLGDATGEAVYGAEITRYHSEWARRIEGEIIPSDTPGETLLLMRAPIGVVVCLIPFNFPIYTLLRKVAPALMAGNSVVVRPSNTTPLSALALAEAIQAAGLPGGVINILTMDHAGAGRLSQAEAVGMITLTGSVSAGRAVMDYAKANIAKTSLELGGKTPVLVGPDADVADVARRLVANKTNHCGQVCTAAARVYVVDALHDALVAALTEAFRARRFADRAQEPDAMGPVASEKARAEIHAMVKRAVAEGASLAAGGVMPEGPGWFYPPTLLAGCRQEMEIIREEVFGPVLAVVRVSDLDEALRLANDHQFGLSSVLFSNDHRKVMQIANSMEAGELYVNRFPADPYQGYHAGWKRSGLGGDDGKHGLLEFTQTRLVVLAP